MLKRRVDVASMEERRSDLQFIVDGESVGLGALDGHEDLGEQVQCFEEVLQRR